MQKQLLGCALHVAIFMAAVLASANVVVGQVETTDVNTFTRISEFVPKGVPVKLSDSILHRSIDDRLVLRFSVDNISADRLSAVQFLVLIVDESGSIRSGQGWRQEKSIEPLSSSQNEFILKYVVEKGNRVVLTAYEAIGSSRSYSVTPTKVLAELSSLKLVKGNNSFVKALGSKLGQTNPCAAAQSAAALACKCGIKSFSCNPQTGEYSFTCFSYQENPTACPDGPPDA